MPPSCPSWPPALPLHGLMAASAASALGQPSGPAPHGELRRMHHRSPRTSTVVDRVRLSELNTSTSTEDNTVPQLVELTEPEAQREIIRLTLDEIAAEVSIALRDARLDFPVYLTVPNSGQSVMTMTCPHDPDPSDGDWSFATAIVCRITGQRLGDVRLRGRSLRCVAAGPTMAASELVADADAGS
jgi:hypothetical protein